MHEHYIVNLVRVIDGDTFVGNVSFHVLGHEFTLKEQHFRLVSIDAPELKGETKEKGEESQEYLKGLMNGKTIKVQVQGKDKYGRWLVIVWANGLQLNEKMVQEGYAKRRDD